MVCTWVVGSSSISVQKVFVIHTRVESNTVLICIAYKFEKKNCLATILQQLP